MKLAKKHAHAVLSFEIALALGGGGLGAFGASGGTRRASVAHDVLIDVLKPADIARLKEPLCPEPDVRFLSPCALLLHVLGSFVKNVDPYLAATPAEAPHRRGAYALDGGCAWHLREPPGRPEALRRVRPGARRDAVDEMSHPQHESVPPFLFYVPFTRRIDEFKATDTQTQTQTIDGQEDPSRDEPDPGQYFGVHLSIRAFLKFLSSHVVSTTTIACTCSLHFPLTPTQNSPTRASNANHTKAPIMTGTDVCFIYLFVKCVLQVYAKTIA